MSRPIEQQKKITPTQLGLMVVQTQVGVGILSLPHEIYEVAKGGSWISTLAAGLLAQLSILLLWTLARRFPQDTFYGISTKLLGKWVGKGLVLLYVLFFLLICAEIIVLFADILGRWVLLKTPRWAMVLLGMVPVVYLARESLRAIARFYVAANFVIIIFIGLTLLAYEDANFYYLFPITEAGWFNILVKGTHQVFISMFGYEIIMVLYPFVQGTSKAKLMAVSLGNFFVTLLYTFVTFTVLVVLNPQEIPLIPEPVIYKHKALSLQVLERIDLIFLSLWIVTVITSVVTYLYFAAVGIKHLINKENMRRKSVSYLAVVILFMVLAIHTPEQMQMSSDLVSYLAYLFFIIIPLLLLLLSLILKNKVTKST